MKKVIFKPKPLSKAEQIYIKQLAKPPAETFKEIISKVQNNYVSRQSE
jgi:hypothetical protein